MKEDIYGFHFKDSKGKTHEMSDYRNKVLIIVNTATKCGLAPQFEGLEKLYAKYKGQGLMVIGFPCNDFADQEPESNANMASACKVNFGVTFPLSEKIHVNGQDTHPLFEYLKENTTSFFGKKIKWNFTKFVVGNTGKPLKRFSPLTKPEEIEKYLLKIL